MFQARPDLATTTTPRPTRSLREDQVVLEITRAGLDVARAAPEITREVPGMTNRRHPFQSQPC